MGWLCFGNQPSLWFLGLWGSLGVALVQVQWSDWPGFSVAAIVAKELLPIVVAVAVAAWGRYWCGKVVRCHCNNQSVVAAIRGGCCRDPAMAHMLRCLFFLEASFNLSLSAVHVAGVNNGAADSNFRNHIDKFFLISPQARRELPVVPEGLVWWVGW